MNCKICNKMIKTKVTWKNLFEVPKYLICNKCSMKYIPDMDLNEYELNDIKVTCFSLYKKRHMINPDCFTLELSKLFEYVFNRYNLFDFIQHDYFLFLYFDNLDTLKNINLLSLLVELTNYEIIIVSTYK